MGLCILRHGERLLRRASGAGGAVGARGPGDRRLHRSRPRARPGRDLATDPHLAGRGYWARCSDGTIVDGVVPRLSITPGTLAAPGPRLGEHTDDVLRELLGMEQSAVDRLRRDAIIR